MKGTFAHIRANTPNNNKLNFEKSIYDIHKVKHATK